MRRVTPTEAAVSRDPPGQEPDLAPEPIQRPVRRHRLWIAIAVAAGAVVLALMYRANW
jgi:hypothetical protein